MKTKKQENKYIIWSNIESISLNEWRDYLEEGGYTEENGYTEDEQINLCEDLRAEYLGDERANLSPIKGKILAFANIERWDGHVHGYKIYDNIQSALYSECDYVEWYVTHKGLFFIGHHHDGTNYCEYRIIHDNVDIDNLTNAIYNKKEISRQKLAYYTKNIAPEIQKIYGFKL